jgi:hypothetical protein
MTLELAYRRAPNTVGVVLGLAVAGLAGCDAKDGAPAPSEGPSCVAVQPGAAPARLLTREQYNNTVRDLLGDASRPADTFPPVATVEGFENNAELHRANPLLVSQYLAAAERVAAGAVERGLSRFLPCTFEAGDAKCGREFIGRFGDAAFRRPLGAEERGAFERLFDKVQASNGFRVAIRLVVEAALQSPQFLYRVDAFETATTESGAVRIGGWEMASRLSYFLWNSMPDESLFQAARRGELAGEQQIEAQARRMLNDEKARGVVVDFHRQWLGFERFSGLVRDAADESGREKRLPAAWQASLEAFVDHVFWTEGGSLSALFSSPTVFVDGDLAALYGSSPPSDGQLHPVQSDPRERAGLLTQPGLLALLSHPNQSSPIRRGVFIRERILCDPLPPPPPDVDTTPPDLDPTLTTRQRFALHTTSSDCAVCHQKIDGIGFGLENYDQNGRFRLAEQGIPIDVTGRIVAARDPALSGDFNGPMELARRIADSPQTRDCVATQWFRYAMGRIENNADACSLTQVQTAFARSNGSFKELLVALTQTDAFLYRPPGENDR